MLVPTRCRSMWDRCYYISKVGRVFIRCICLHWLLLAIAATIHQDRTLNSSDTCASIGFFLPCLCWSGSHVRLMKLTNLTACNFASQHQVTRSGCEATSLSSQSRHADTCPWLINPMHNRFRCQVHVNSAFVLVINVRLRPAHKLGRLIIWWHRSA
jgi:hypothetical protein